MEGIGEFLAINVDRFLPEFVACAAENIVTRHSHCLGRHAPTGVLTLAAVILALFGLNSRSLADLRVTTQTSASIAITNGSVEVLLPGSSAHSEAPGRADHAAVECGIGFAHFTVYHPMEGASRPGQAEGAGMTLAVQWRDDSDVLRVYSMAPGREVSGSVRCTQSEFEAGTDRAQVEALLTRMIMPSADPLPTEAQGLPVDLWLGEVRHCGGVLQIIGMSGPREHTRTGYTSAKGQYLELSSGPARKLLVSPDGAQLLIERWMGHERTAPDQTDGATLVSLRDCSAPLSTTIDYASCTSLGVVNGLAVADSGDILLQCSDEALWDSVKLIRPDGVTMASGPGSSDVVAHESAQWYLRRASHVLYESWFLSGSSDRYAPGAPIDIDSTQYVLVFPTLPNSALRASRHNTSGNATLISGLEPGTTPTVTPLDIGGNRGVQCLAIGAHRWLLIEPSETLVDESGDVELGFVAIEEVVDE